MANCKHFRENFRCGILAKGVIFKVEGEILLASRACARVIIYRVVMGRRIK